jgi:hypothetical protein
MKKSSEIFGEARDAEAIKLLKSDPAAYFEKTRRQSFGFASSTPTDDCDQKESD